MQKLPTISCNYIIVFSNVQHNIFWLSKCQFFWYYILGFPQSNWLICTYIKLFLCRKLANKLQHWRIQKSSEIYFQSKLFCINYHLCVIGVLFSLQKPDKYRWCAIANKCSTTMIDAANCCQQISKYRLILLIKNYSPAPQTEIKKPNQTGFLGFFNS